MELFILKYYFFLSLDQQKKIHTYIIEQLVVDASGVWYPTGLNSVGFNPSLKNLAYIATLMYCDTAKQSVCGWQYIYIYREREREWEKEGSENKTDRQHKTGLLWKHFRSSSYIYIRVCLISYYIFSNPYARTGYNRMSIFKRNSSSVNSKVLFFQIGCHTKVKEPNLLFLLTIARGRLVGNIPFLRTFASSRIWTQVTVSILYDYTHYTKCVTTALSHNTTRDCGLSVTSWEWHI